MADQDGDGFSNYAEYIAKTAPDNGSDFLKVVQQLPTNTGFVVRFPTQTQREYYLWYANQTLLGAPWSLVSTNPFAGTGGIVEWTDDGTLTTPAPAAATNRYYRVQVDLPR